MARVGAAKGGLSTALTVFGRNAFMEDETTDAAVDAYSARDLIINLRRRIGLDTNCKIAALSGALSAVFSEVGPRRRNLCARALDRADYLITGTRLSVLDRLAGPPPETPTDRAIREQGERLRQALPQVDFDDPARRPR
jgi:hypothetical protein